MLNVALDSKQQEVELVCRHLLHSRFLQEQQNA